MSIHVYKCEHNGCIEYHLRYPGMSEETAQNIADKINSGALDTSPPASQEHMTVLDLADDDALRFACRVLESDAPEQDRKSAREMLYAIRKRVRKTASHSQAQQPSGPHLFEFWWEAHMPQATQAEAWAAWQAAHSSKGVGIEQQPKPQPMPWPRINKRMEYAAQDEFHILTPRLKRLWARMEELADKHHHGVTSDKEAQP